jgi:histidyl-tRNA synthetase
VELYGGAPTPAAGFAAGDVVLAELLREKGLAPPVPPRSICYLVAVDDGDRGAVIALAQELRGRGISCEFSLKSASIGKQMKSANAARSEHVLFVGGDEAKNGMVKVKRMDTGEERLFSRGGVAEAVAGLHSAQAVTGVGFRRARGT